MCVCVAWDLVVKAVAACRPHQSADTKLKSAGGKNIYHINLHLYIVDLDYPRHSVSSMFDSVLITKIKRSLY